MANILNFDEYNVAWIAVLLIEAEAALGMLDTQHDGQFETACGDNYIYIGGEINMHKVVVATLPAGQNYGPGAAAALVNQVKACFKNIWFVLLVGVAAGLPNFSLKPPAKPRDTRLGDVLVCIPEKASVGIVHYDLGSDTEECFLPTGRQAEPPTIIRAAIRNIQLTKEKPFKKGNIFAIYLATFQGKADDSRFFCSS
ncbi:hypothetical protein OIDMADRAFT_34247 [Oidiodendron maius Zn]|uniref:Nucleoside phosphorylase domain-containing protein n=1 Tax=Oidiodendron maius (strain Zn) TaxID=913774 RepID=A0A0C3C9A7_OIDMZ|nr:hypothetical protein OIDMADRAFT_34247 [Oidiodendron maius Zn]